jgi:membrane-associated phospholipid phosphatase
MKTEVKWFGVNYPILYKVFIVYALFSLVFYFFLPFSLTLLIQCLLPRILLIIFPILIEFISSKNNLLKQRKQLIIQLFPFILLGFFYSETAKINSLIFLPQDAFFFKLDEYIFGFQPSLEFSNRFHSLFMVETMSFGYIFYYFLSFGTPLLFLNSFNKFSRIVFILIFSFLLYYIVFIIFPVSGPQFYLPYPQNKMVEGGFFTQLLKIIHKVGEGPTAAFPSSHVGIAVICMMLIFSKSKKLFLLILPLFLILCLSTVYIKAHYFVDVIGGLISAPIFYYLSKYVYSKLLNIK